MKRKKISTPKQKACAKKPASTMELLKNELYDIIRKEDETEEQEKEFARKDLQKYKEYKEKELFKIMEVVSRCVRELDSNVGRVLKILEDITTSEKGAITEVSEDVGLEGKIVFSGEVYPVSSLIDKLKDKYGDNSFSVSMSRSAMFTSSKRPKKEEWSAFIEGLVKDKILVSHPKPRTTSQPRFKFP